MMATSEELSAQSNPTQTVKYDPKSQTVTLPSGLVSVAGVTVVTGGAELSCGSCMLAFAVWGTVVGLSIVSLGLWDLSVYSGPSHLLALGLVLLLTSLSLVAMIFVLRLIMKKRRMKARRERAEANLVLINDYAEVVLKRVTV
ncbi:transmembrane protein 100-like [Pseudorasbora parva]|uniref:transmembrane protein 100-like n=1 Tax=Pseudorasbora parva TaxID=51549 RepID=UPI00351DC92C